MAGFGAAFEQNKARIRKVVSFAEESAAALTEAVNEWLENAGEKDVIDTQFLSTCVEAESVVLTEYACFIIYTE